MQELMKNGNTPMLFPFEPEEFWKNIRQIIKEEVGRIEKEKADDGSLLETPGLTLVFYVFDKASGINSLQCNDHFARLQMKLFGVDQGSLKKNLELILGRKKGLTERK